METFVLTLYGFWFWLTRDYRSTHYGEAASTLNSARAYLLSDFTSRASARDRGTLLPHQVEALTILEKHSAFVDRTSHRFASLSECCRFVTEELTQSEAQAVTRSHVASVTFITPISADVAPALQPQSNRLNSWRPKLPRWTKSECAPAGELVAAVLLP